MQILIPHSWLKTFLDTEATPQEIQKSLSLCGPSVERLHQKDSDFVYDIEVTTNRVDCMSVYGIAREAAAILPRFNHQAKLLSDPFQKKLSFKTSNLVPYLMVAVDPKLCSRFTAILVKHVSYANSPDWLVKRLELAGLRSLNNIVDISNYLMLEMGQPVHTFDYDKIQAHRMILRSAKKNENITTLDGKNHTLSGGDIVIEDGSGQLIDLCGIMGGQLSAVDEHTKNVLLFVQTYEPNHIRKTSMNLGHRTDAAVLFEKGLSPESVLPTIQSALELFRDPTGGAPERIALDKIITPSHPTEIQLSQPLSKFATHRIGVTISPSESKQILTSLGFKVNSKINITVPWYRSLDVTLPEDLVEEIARIYGYFNMPSSLMTGTIPNQQDDQSFIWESKIKYALFHWGFTETYSYSLLSKELADPAALRLSNPLSSEWEYLRTSLVPSHLQLIKDNIGKANELNFFEISNVYLPRKNELPVEELHLIISTTRDKPLYLKGIAQALLEKIAGLVPDENIYQIESHTNPTCLTWEINLAKLLPNANHYRLYHPISKFSPIIEDVNIILNRPYSELVADLKKISSLIVQIELIDKYADKLTLRLTFHSNTKQLSSDDIAPLREKISKLSILA